ncbi:hypothetical protein ACWELB_45630 [Streptomyces asiaticus]
MRVLLGVIGAVIVPGIFSSVLRTLVIPRRTPAGPGAGPGGAACPS